MQTGSRNQVRTVATVAVFAALTVMTTVLVGQRLSPQPAPVVDARSVTRGLARVRLIEGPPLEGFGIGAIAPQSLASADFDEDGVADLIAGAVAGNRPVVALYRGTSAPNADHQPPTPFLAPVIYEVAIAPHLLATGDFDADGHSDVVIAARGASHLAFLRGDGHGAFERTAPLELPGALTDIVAGEVNRADGLVDLALSVAGPRGSRVLVYSGDNGALRSDPTELTLPGAPTGLAFGHLDDDWFGDLAVVVRDEMSIYHGSGTDVGDDIPAPFREVSRATLPRAPVSLAAGRFDPADPGRSDLAFIDDDAALHAVTRRRGEGHAWQLRTLRSSLDPAGGAPVSQASSPALSAAPLSASGVDDIVVVDRAGRRVFVVPGTGSATATTSAAGAPAIVQLSGTPVAVLPMRLDRDATSDLVVFEEGADAPHVLLTTAGRTFVVDNPGDDPDCDITDGLCRIGPVDSNGKCMGGCTFRAALHEANVGPDLDTITFALGAGTPTVLKRGGADWTAIHPVTIDGQTGGATRVHLDANGVGNTLILRGGSSAIRNLVITGGSAGLYVHTNGGNIFEGNWIGLHPSGASAQPNPGPGMLIISPLNTIGGTAAAARNVVAASGLSGIEVRNATGNRILGNFIGTDATGTTDLGNALSGVYLELSPNTTIGGAVAGARNVISGNNATGQGGVHANISPSLTLQGNYIGTSASGNAPIGNSGPGVRIVSGANEVIGGTTAAARNVIAANGDDGVVIRSINSSEKALIQGNYIGTAANGTLLGNAGAGIAVEGTHDNTIGGTTASSSNVIAGNGGAGVVLQFAGVHPAGNSVRGNSMRSNGGLGIDLDGDGVTANDACDVDTGANGRQNAPVITGVSGLTTIVGTLNAKASTTFLVDFYSSAAADASGSGEGQTYLGTKSVTTDAGCNASFTATFNKVVAAGQVVTATATDPAKNTSEFSAAVSASAAIAVKTPNTAVTWGIGTVQRLQWSHNLGAGSLVKIEISRDGGATYSVIAASVKNTATSGTYNWTVTGPATTRARIRVSAVNDPAVNDPSNVNFTVGDPFVTVTTPNSPSDVWTVGTARTVQWANNLGSAEKVLIELSRDGGLTYPIVLFATTPSDGKQSVDVQPSWATSAARVRVTWTKNTAVSDSSDQDFPVQ